MRSDEYFAGFFDGEGYVGVSYQEAWNAYMIRVSVVNNNKPVLLLFKEKYGGTIRPPSDKKAYNMKGAWTWWIHGQPAIDFLQNILPYVFVKRPQVELAIEFPIGKPGQRVTEEVRLKRKYMFEKLQSMKQDIWTEPSLDDAVVHETLGDREDIRRAIEMYQSGMTLDEVSRQLGVSPGTVGYWTRQLDVVRERSASAKIGSEKRLDGTKSSEAQEAKLLYESGMSTTDVAKKLGRKPATVNYWLRQMGATRTLEQAQKLRRSKE